MKNKLYYLGIATTLLISGGGLCKIMHWPLAGILLAVGILFLALLFLPLAIYSSFKIEPNKKFKSLYILFAIVFALNFISALFKIMHWPGANILLIISLPLPFVVILPVYLLSNKNDKEINYKNFMAILFFFAYFAAISALLSLSVQKEVLDGFIKSAYSFENKTNALTENNNWQTDTFEKDTITKFNSKFSIIRNEADRICSKIENLKKTIVICYSGNAAEVIKSDGKIDLWKTKFKDSKPYYNWQNVTEIKNEISNFKNIIQKECESDKALINYINEVFATSDNTKGKLVWEKTLVNEKIFASVIESLNLLQYQVRLAQYEVFISIQ